jgi:hypothetical protein
VHPQVVDSGSLLEEGLSDYNTENQKVESASNTLVVLEHNKTFRQFILLVDAVVQNHPCGLTFSVV